MINVLPLSRMMRKLLREVYARTARALSKKR
jgi:hypothetical protein